MGEKKEKQGRVGWRKVDENKRLTEGAPETRLLALTIFSFFIIHLFIAFLSETFLYAVHFVAQTGPSSQ